ncbi:membrane protein insertase YidC [Sphingomicrobium aestuariivivum]|uniref:membrane protein insertase YidC n=1 Tax=Sphingomicrobium aestuariivivum TaxID=1582356 RepID=UPI001FD6EDEC|nr:membrane protein insertase YidC [Sphingomicrobium aestuariivivum]MCJ8190130.1 membrane protein insertase YidC [Sphingomicrobium aestuariivivum]
MNQNRNMLLAIVLSALVLIGWSLLGDRYFPTSTEDETSLVEADAPSTAPDGAVVPTSDTLPAAEEVATAPRDADEVIAEGGRVTIDTPSVDGSLNLTGARFDDLMLKRHSVELDGEEEVRLLAPAGSNGAYFAQYGWTGEGVEVPGASTVWTADGDTLTPETPVTLSWSNGTGQTFIQKISVDEDYLFTIEQRVENRSANAVAIRPFALASRAEQSQDESFWTVHVGPMGVFDDAADYDVSYEDLEEAGPQGERRTTTGGWLGFTDKYWLTALVPDQGSRVTATMRQGASGAFQTDYLGAPVVLQPNQASDFRAQLFAGAKEKGVLDAYEDAGIPKLSKSIDWGWFEWFMRPLFDLLRLLFDVTGNFGVAIILMTFLVRGALYPLANKQFRSMAGMRRVQPKLKALQERYKDDKPRLQQEMLKLYQEEKLNPAAGCLPILLQIPVFYALYKVLLVSVEMRHQPFVLWLQDLSAPDPLTPVNLFGLLPFDPPGMLAIGILPILLGITMWLQFKLNPAPMDDIQKQVFGIMPWILMFVMAPFAAGLQLYWVTSNILTIAQQKYLYRKYDLEKDSMKAGAHPKGT